MLRTIGCCGFASRTRRAMTLAPRKMKAPHTLLTVLKALGAVLGVCIGIIAAGYIVGSLLVELELYVDDTILSSDGTYKAVLFHTVLGIDSFDTYVSILPAEQDLTGNTGNAFHASGFSSDHFVESIEWTDDTSVLIMLRSDEYISKQEKQVGEVTITYKK